MCVCGSENFKILLPLSAYIQLALSYTAARRCQPGFINGQFWHSGNCSLFCFPPKYHSNFAFEQFYTKRTNACPCNGSSTTLLLSEETPVCSSFPNSHFHNQNTTPFFSFFFSPSRQSAHLRRICRLRLCCHPPHISAQQGHVQVCVDGERPALRWERVLCECVFAYLWYCWIMMTMMIVVHVAWGRWQRRIDWDSVWEPQLFDVDDFPLVCFFFSFFFFFLTSAHFIFIFLYIYKTIQSGPPNPSTLPKHGLRLWLPRLAAMARPMLLPACAANQQRFVCHFYFFLCMCIFEFLTVLYHPSRTSPTHAAMTATSSTGIPSWMVSSWRTRRRWIFLVDISFFFFLPHFLPFSYLSLSS